jgi:predicted TIM-barrel fold metal-dependent hydrolase
LATQANSFHLVGKGARNTDIKAIDMHSHCGTKKGYLWRTPEDISRAERHFRFQAVYKTEEEQAEYFRKNNVRVILDLGFPSRLPLEEAREYHDYAGQLQRDYPDVILGNWINVSPRLGRKGLQEVERCLKDQGGIGFSMMGTTGRLPPNDKLFWPFYELCIEAKAPVLLNVGFTGEGAGHPGGKGLLLEHCHPRYVDEVAATFPELTIIAGRPAWPWQNEMIAILLHKPNVWNELHGWPPKYLAPELKWDISRRLQDKVMLGCDYPLFLYERLFQEWEAEGFAPEILEKVFHKNAERLFESLGKKI